MRRQFAGLAVSLNLQCLRLKRPSVDVDLYNNLGHYMPRTLYCWRCRTDIPMLTEAEWEIVSPELANAVGQIKAYREQIHCSLSEARANGFGKKALALYAKMTGFSETNPDALFHHRLSIYGPPCGTCHKPLRTPEASICAACGSSRYPAAR